MARTREEAAPRRSGRVTTATTATIATTTTNAGVQKPAPTGRPRGRPRKNPPKVPSGRPRGRPKGSVKKAEDKKTPAPVKTGTGKRGRPRKVLGGEAAKIAKAAAAPNASVAAPGVKRGRGRPRKVVVDATGAAEVETVEEAKDAVEKEDVEDGGADEAGETDDAANVHVKGDVDSADDAGGPQGEDEDEGEADDSVPGAAPSGKETGQWMSKIKGIFG